MALSVFSYANIVVISAAIAFIEGISLLLIYRTLAHNSVRSSIESSAAAAKAKKRSILAYSLILAIVLAVYLSLLSNFKSDIAIAAVIAIVTRLLNYILLPPFTSPVVLNMTHGGLTVIAIHCSMTFFYLLCSIIMEINLRRFFRLPMLDAKNSSP